jgi:hypothetical protein
LNQSDVRLKILSKIFVLKKLGKCTINLRVGLVFSGLFLVGYLAICTLIELLSMWNLTRIEVQLCNMLSPEAPKMSLASYNWGLVSTSKSLLSVKELGKLHITDSAIAFVLKF